MRGGWVGGSDISNDISVQYTIIQQISISALSFSILLPKEGRRAAPDIIDARTWQNRLLQKSIKVLLKSQGKRVQQDQPLTFVATRKTQGLLQMTW